MGDINWQSLRSACLFLALAAAIMIAWTSQLPAPLLWASYLAAAIAAGYILQLFRSIW